MTVAVASFLQTVTGELGAIASGLAAINRELAAIVSTHLAVAVTPDRRSVHLGHRPESSANDCGICREN